jgi:hypothetical protein
MLGRQPQKVDCAVNSTTSNVTVGMVFHFGHVDGEERVVGIVVLVALWQSQFPDLVLEA